MWVGLIQSAEGLAEQRNDPPPALVTFNWNIDSLKLEVVQIWGSLALPDSTAACDIGSEDFGLASLYFQNCVSQFLIINLSLYMALAGKLLHVISGDTWGQQWFQETQSTRPYHFRRYWPTDKAIPRHSGHWDNHTNSCEVHSAANLVFTCFLGSRSFSIQLKRKKM